MTIRKAERTDIAELLEIYKHIKTVKSTLDERKE